METAPTQKPSQAKGIGSDVYTGVAVYGRFRAVLGAIIGVIIALIIIIIGFFRLRDPHTASAPMTVTAVTSCVMHTSSAGQNGSTVVSYLCVVSVSFTASDSKTYAASGVSVRASAPLTAGSVIQLRYDPRNPTSVVQEISPRALGYALIGGGVLLGGITVGLAVLTFKSKGFAAVEGTAGLLGSLRL